MQKPPFARVTVKNLCCACVQILHMTSYLIIAKLLKIETVSDTVHSPFLKKLIDLGAVRISMIDEQFVRLEAVNWIDQNFQWLQSMVHLSVQSPLERSQVMCGHNPLSP